MDASTESRCQVFHVCNNLAERTSVSRFYSFLCPNGTVFNQLYYICDWWFNVDCQDNPLELPNNNKSQKTLKVSINDTKEGAESENIIHIDTIYSAIQAANDKYESQNIQSKKSKTLSATVHSKFKNRRNEKFKWKGRRPKG